MQGILNCQNHFQAQDSDIILVTTPKSGTTCFRALAFAILNRKTHYPISPHLDDSAQTCRPHPLLTTDPHDLVPFLDMNLYYQKTMPDLSSLPSPRLFASHLPYVLLAEWMKQSGCKIVYLCRNPKDLFVSGWQFANKIRSETGGQFQLRIHSTSFGRSHWFWTVLGSYVAVLQGEFGGAREDMLLRYEELKDEPVRILKNLANFMGSGFPKDEEENGNVVENILKLCSLESLRNLEVNKSGKMKFGVVNNAYFRQGAVGDWQNFLTLDMMKR